MQNREFKKPNTDSFVKRAWNLRKRYSYHRTFKRVLGTSQPKNWLTRLLVQIGNTCTAYTAIAIKEATTPGVQFDPAKQWDAELALNGSPAPDGVTADVMMQTGVKTGFYREGSSTPSDKEEHWFTLTSTLNLDLFDQMKLSLATAPLAVSLNWYSDWDNTTGPVPHTFNSLLGGHETKAYAVEIVNGIECIMVQGSWGDEHGINGCFPFDRYMVNKCFFDVRYWGSVASADVVRLGFIGALLMQMVGLYHQLISQKEGYPPKPIQPHISRIKDWANAVIPNEGAKPELNNPGNLKYTTLTASWGAEKGFQAVGATPLGVSPQFGYIAKFPTYDQGFQALCNFLTLGAQDELMAFHNARTLRLFTKVYANPRDDKYALNVATELGVDIDIPISQLL